MLELKNVTFSYSEQEILKGISFALKPGEIGAIIGPSGSGKTTLFKILSGLLRPNAGEVAISSTVNAGIGSDIACMMQEDLLLPWRTVYDNLAVLGELGLSPSSLNTHEIHAILKEMGLASCGLKYPHQLSIGMRQRVSLARALLQKRPILLLDEPFGSLDVRLREQMYALLLDIRKKHGTTMVLITHDFRDAMTLADQIFFLQNGVIKRQWALTESSKKDAQRSNEILQEMRATFDT